MTSAIADRVPESSRWVTSLGRARSCGCTDEGEGVDEVVAHGVTARRAGPRREHALRAGEQRVGDAAPAAMHSTPAAMNSVLKLPLLSASKIGLPEALGTTNAAMVASEMIVTAATRRPAMIVGRASGSSTRDQDLRRRQAAAAGGVEDVGRHAGQPGQGVGEQDQQRVRDQRDLDGE